MHAFFEGWPLPVQAVAWALLSALSLPIGAAVGLALSPVDGYLVANIIAFGAGCLLFAVTVELYGHQLFLLDLERGSPTELAVSVCAAIVGALLYIVLNRWVESSEGSSAEPEEAEALDAMEKAYRAVEQSKIAPPRETTPLAPKPREASFTRESTGTPRSDAAKRWARVKSVMQMSSVRPSVVELKHGKVPAGDAGARALALGMLAGIVADGIPEAVLIGFLVSEGHLSFMLVASLFVANFPESFASASLMKEHRAFSSGAIVLLWAVPMALTGLFAGLTTWLAPPSVQQMQEVRLLAASFEGIAGGMMLTMIGSVMLPQAFNMAKENEPWRLCTFLHQEHHGGDIPGIFCVLGFFAAVGLKVAGSMLHATH